MGRRMSRKRQESAFSGSGMTFYRFMGAQGAKNGAMSQARKGRKL